MALSKKLTKEKPDTSTVEKLILKGGTSGQEEGPAEGDEKIRPVQLRLSIGLIASIDRSRKKRHGKVSRHTWLVEAIEEKLVRENKEA